MGTIKCTETKQIYRNRSNGRKDVTLTVDDKCDRGEGGPQVIVNDARGHAVERFDMPPGGDTETFTVPGGGSLEVTCVGFEGDGCAFNVVAVSPGRRCCLFFWTCRGRVVPIPARTFVFLSAIALNSPALADDIEQGRTAYLQNCASCHGDDGKGGGSASARLRIRPADLTTLARRNRGIYAPAAVYQTVDGRKALRSHRTSAMPIWGCRQEPSGKRAGKADKGNELESLLDLSCDAEPVIRRRIESIVRYLGTIQVK